MCSDAVRSMTSRSGKMPSHLLMLLLATLTYPGGVAGDVSEAGLAGAVAGTFVGTMLLCAVLVAAGYWCYTRKCRQKDAEQQRCDPETPDNSAGKQTVLI